MRASVSRMHGVTLVEMALVLLILGILTRAAITPLAAVQKHRNYRLVESNLQIIKDSLWSHTVATGVLPCPVSLDHSEDLSEGPFHQSSFRLQSQGDCQTAQGGVPAQTLGLAGAMTSGGALLDPWNRPYQLAVSLVSHAERGSVELADWTTAGEVSRVGIAQIDADLVLCNGPVGTRCPANEIRANQLVFVLYSLGEDPSGSGAQAENQDADSVFVLQDISLQPDKPFDDQLVWGTAAEALYWMLRAGWLP